MIESNDKISLITQNENHDGLHESLTMKDYEKYHPSTNQPNNKLSSLNICMLILAGLIGLAIIAYVGILLVQRQTDLNDGKVHPVKIKLAIYDNVTIIKGNSRVFQVLFYSGHDDRGSNQLQIVTQRDLVWNVQPQGVIEVDQYGRIDALKEGNATIRVYSSTNKYIFDSKTINVVAQTSNSTTQPLPKTIVNYTGTPSDPFNNPQKIVTRIPKEEVQASLIIPDSIKKVSLNPLTSLKNTKVLQQNGNIIWQVRKYADGSDNTYVRRIDYSLDDKNRDKMMYFIGNRYLPQDGKYALSIEDDKQLGLWIVGKNGSVTHISMITLSYVRKAEMMVKDTQQRVLRQGMAAGAQFDTVKNKWIPDITDNDGLWTALYAAGQLMRYDYLRSINETEDKIKQAKQSAFPSLKAVLITDWISGRSGTVDSKLRYFNNSRTARAYKLSSSYLKKGKTFAVENYAGSPVDKVGYYGFDANKTVDGSYFGGSFKYSLNPLNLSDWTMNEEPATTKRTLGGFMARTFGIPELDGQNRYGGLFFQRYPNGSHKVLSQASALYDYTNDDHPMLDIGNQPLPQILKDVLFANGKQYDIYDMVYKGETSTDEVIGHLFLYKIAFDILDENDPEQKELKQLIKQTMINFSQHLINNGYRMVDATGQGTSWSKLVRDFFNSDYTMEDAPLKALQLILSFKLTYYVTGDDKFQKEIDYLVNDPSFMYAELVEKFWQRWAYFNQNQDYDPSMNLYRFNFTKNATEQELMRHHLYTFHYSDDEEGMLAFYLIFQLQKNETLLGYYKKGMQAYWNHIKYSENPLWYYIYQLAYPKDHDLKDGFGDSLLQKSAWQLSRHPIDTTKFQAFIQGSRPDVIVQGTISTNPFVVIGRRSNEADAGYVNNPYNHQIYPQFDPWNMYQVHTLPADERSIHKFNGVNFQNIHSSNSNDMQAATTYTLPYWFGVYHKMLTYSN